MDSNYKPLWIESYLCGVTQDQFERYQEYIDFMMCERCGDYINDIQEFLEENGECYGEWFDVFVTYEELFAHEVLTGQNGVNINDELRSCFNKGIESINVYDY